MRNLESTKVLIKITKPREIHVRAYELFAINLAAGVVHGVAHDISGIDLASALVRLFLYNMLDVWKRRNR